MRRAGFTKLTAATRFDARAALACADAILRDPPARSWIVRMKPEGRLVVRFALPLELCEPQNKRRFAPAWAMSQKRSDILMLFQAQLGGRLPADPLPGRPIVECTRFSSRAPDATANSFKLAVDCLSPSRVRRYNGVPRKIPGIGLIVDDNQDVCDVREKWEYAAARSGFAAGVIEVWTGVFSGAQSAGNGG